MRDMKPIMLAQLAAVLSVAAWAGTPPAPHQGQIAVGEIFSIALPCNPTTGYQWELKSINQRIAISTGAVEFQASPTAPGTVGAGGSCVLRIKGVRPGKTMAIMVYWRPWEKGKPAKTATTEITVLPKKKSSKQK
jgi:inhibitor of cysteine peptidase